MRGILAGSLTLIVLYVVVQPGSADKANTAAAVLQKALRRALSPAVAGVPQRAAAKTTTSGSASPEFGSVPDKGYANIPHNAQGYPL